MFKKGEKVKVRFEQPDGSFTCYCGKFREVINIGMVDKLYGIVRISKAGSLMAPLTQIERIGL